MMLATEGKVKKHLTIRPIVTGNDILGFGEYIHASLSGNQDYIDSRILVHLDGYNENPDHRVDAIEIFMFDDCESYPVIIKMLEDIRELTTDDGTEIFIEVGDGELIEEDEGEEFDYNAAIREENSKIISLASEANDIFMIEPQKRGIDMSAFAEYFCNIFKQFIDNEEIDVFYDDDYQIIRVFILGSMYNAELRKAILGIGSLPFNGNEISIQWFAEYSDYDRYIDYHYNGIREENTEAIYNEEINCIEIENSIQLNKYHRVDTNSYVFIHDGEVVNVKFNIPVSLMRSTIIAKDIIGDIEVSADTIICNNIEADNIICNKLIVKDGVTTTSDTEGREHFKVKLFL